MKVDDSKVQGRRSPHVTLFTVRGSLLAGLLVLTGVTAPGCALLGGPGSRTGSAGAGGRSSGPLAPLGSLLGPLGAGAGAPASGGGPLSGPATGDLGRFVSPEALQAVDPGGGSPGRGGGETVLASASGSDPVAAPAQPAAQPAPVAQPAPAAQPASSPTRPANTSVTRFMSDTVETAEGGEPAPQAMPAPASEPSWRLPEGTMM